MSDNWLTYVQPKLIVNPSLAEHIGDWYVNLEQVRSSNGVKTVYTAAHVKVGC